MEYSEVYAMNKISKFYEGKTVLLFGATGFVGKVFVERLLSTCETVKKVYIVIRPKKGRKRLNMSAR